MEIETVAAVIRELTKKTVLRPAEKKSLKGGKSSVRAKSP